MGKNERQAYLKAIRLRYRRARKKLKVTILDEFCSVCGYNRKYAIRLLNQRASAITVSVLVSSAVLACSAIEESHPRITALGIS